MYDVFLGLLYSIYVHAPNTDIRINYLFFFFQAEDGIRDLVRSRGLGDVYKRQPYFLLLSFYFSLLIPLLILLRGMAALTQTGLPPQIGPHQGIPGRQIILLSVQEHIIFLSLIHI